MSSRGMMQIDSTSNLDVEWLDARSAEIHFHGGSVSIGFRRKTDGLRVGTTNSNLANALREARKMDVVGGHKLP